MHMTHHPIDQTVHEESSYGTAHWCTLLVFQIAYHVQDFRPARHCGHGHVLLPCHSVHVHYFIQIQPVEPFTLSSPGQLYDWCDRSFGRRFTHVPNVIHRLWQLWMVSWYGEQWHRPASDGL